MPINTPEPPRVEAPALSARLRSTSSVYRTINIRGHNVLNQKNRDPVGATQAKIGIHEFRMLSCRSVVLHEDDVAMTHGANLAFAELFAFGSCSAGSVMVPCPWFPEAADLVATNRELDVGVHLTLTSEKRPYRWRPLTAPPRSAGMTDEFGYLWADVTSVRRSAVSEAVEIELRAQITLHVAGIKGLIAGMVVEPENVEAPTRSGLSKDAIRTSCLGFRDDYNEVVLATMSFGETEIKGCTSAHLVRIRGTQNADVVVLNEEVIAVIANQIAGKATREAADQARKGGFDEGLRSINLACATIQGFAASELTTEAKDLLDESLRMVGSRKMSFRDLKDLVYESRYFARTSSHTLYTGARKRSNLGRKPSSQEQCQQPEQ